MSNHLSSRLPTHQYHQWRWETRQSVPISEFPLSEQDGWPTTARLGIVGSVPHPWTSVSGVPVPLRQTANRDVAPARDVDINPLIIDHYHDFSSRS